MNKLTTLIISCWLTLSAPAQASVIQELVVFGDSLSDSGNLFLASGNPPPPYFQGRFSNGPNYVDYLGQALNIAVAPSLLGGNNYAWGAARARMDTPVGGGLSIPGVATQVNMYLNAQAGAPVPVDALTIMHIGNNDVADAVDQNLTLGQATPFYSQVIQEITQAMQTLQNQGAREFLVPLVPDWSITPEYLNDSNAQQLSFLFNQMYTQALTSMPGLDILIFDTPAAIESTLAHFNNTTMSCLSTGCQNPEDFFFFDNFHPTTRAHLLLSQEVLLAIPSPSTLMLMLLIGLLVTTRRLKLG